MIVHVDTSALVDALTGPRRSLDELIALTGQGRLACAPGPAPTNPPAATAHP